MIAKALDLSFFSNKLEDIVSHWMLRIAYANNKDSFTNLEGHLFKIRLESLLEKLQGSNHRDEVLLGILRRFYDSVEFDLEVITVQNTKFVRVPFEDAISLMAEHKVIVKNGMAEVSQRNFSNLIRLLYMRNLKEEINAQTEAINEYLQTDERLRKLAIAIPQMSTGKDYSKSEHNSYKGQIFVGDIYALAAQSFPLCMQEMHEHLMKHHHLRHAGRLQYMAFLKGAGLKHEDSKTFFKREFSKGDPKKLNEFMYIVDHMYGLKGKKTSYTPWSCNKLITQNVPGNGDVHGCPFEFYGEHALANTLRKKLNQDQIDQVFEAWKNPSKGKSKNPGVLPLFYPRTPAESTSAFFIQTSE
jgi:DNA primase large subunit